MNTQRKRVLRDEESSIKRRRKSPRRSRVESSGTRKAQQQQSRFRSLREDELQGPPSRTRASLRRRHHEPSSTKIKVEKKKNQEDRSRNGKKAHVIEPKENSETDAKLEEPMVAAPSTQPLPDKQTLELIIDSLQRKDVREIFAEPVDPEEVEDYYEIIEEPMDFGTMRAKLHEGLYTSLEQFEHDVFLISGNAMHFNSSGTVFFKQAHAIDKQAKRIFRVLRTSPENFESEFGGSRRRSFRRSEDGFNELNGKSFLQSSDKRGGRDVKGFDFVEVDRRSAYKPPLDLNNEKSSKSLIHLNHEEHNYRDSLMQFVKDLGPTAQMVAKRKLQNLLPNHQPTGHGFSNQIQIPFGHTSFNPYRSFLNDQIMRTSSIATQNYITRDQDLRSVYGMDTVERTSDNMLLSYSHSHIESVITSTSTPAWLPQGSHGSRITLDLDFLKPKMDEETSSKSCKSFDAKDLTLQL